MTIDAVSAYTGTVPNKDLQTSSAYSLNADGFMPWIATTFPIALSAFATQANAVGAQCDAAVATATAVRAQCDAAAATATAGATTALIARDQAQASAITAQTYAPMWVSGSYTMGNAAWSPIDFHTYRCKITGSRTTDPANDPTNWEDMSPLPTAKLVASGNLSAGSLVQLTYDGKVEVCADPNVQFISNAATWISSCYDATNSKVVVCYRDGSNTYGYAVVGTISGSTISFGTPVAFNSAATLEISACACGGGKIVISYQDFGAGSGYGKSIVGTISGTTISFGTAVTFSAFSNTSSIISEWDVTNSKIVIAYIATSAYLYTIAGAVSGTTISFGTAVYVVTVSNLNQSISYSTADSSFLVACQYSNSAYLCVVTVSGTTISASAANVISLGGSTSLKSICYSGGHTFLLVYSDISSGTNVTKFIALTMSGTTVTAGTAVGGYYELPVYILTKYDTVNSQVVLFITSDYYKTNSHFCMLTISVSGTVPTITSRQDVDLLPIPTSASNPATLVYTGSAFVLSAQINGYGKAKVFIPYLSGLFNRWFNRFLGFSKVAYSSGASASILIQGNRVSGLSGLSIGMKYYLSLTGTLTIDNTQTGVYAGIADSTTSLLIGA